MQTEIIIEYPTYKELETRVLDRNDALLRQYTHENVPDELSYAMADGFYRLASAVANYESEIKKIMILQEMYEIMCRYSNDLTFN